MARLLQLLQPGLQRQLRCQGRCQRPAHQRAANLRPGLPLQPPPPLPPPLQSPPALPAPPRRMSFSRVDKHSYALKHAVQQGVGGSDPA